MAALPEFFEIEFESTILKVRTLYVQKQTLFRITFPSTLTKPFTIGRAEGDNGVKFWTCMPEDMKNHELAKKIGPLIEIFYRSLNP